MPTANDYNAYLNFVLYAVYGKMAEADGIMRRDGRGVRAVAAHLRKRLGTPAKTKTMWRGILLEPDRVQGHPGDYSIQPDPRLEFASWSTDKDVACWFARRDSVVSGFVSQQRPRVRGWMMKQKVVPGEILWWAKWDQIPTPTGTIPLLAAAAQHPYVEDPPQFDWNMGTQQEVIAEPIRAPIKVIPVEDAGCPSTAKLDATLTWPPFRK